MEEPFELPEGWAFATLGDVGRYINGRAFKPSEWEDKGLPIIRIQNLTGTSSKFNRCSKEIEDRYYVNNGNLLISWSASLGVFIWDGSDALLNQHIFRVEPNHDLVTKKFLFYASKYVLRELEKKTHGTGMVHVTKGMFEETKIPLPPLNEQRHIVAKLEKLLSQANASKEHLAKVPALIKQFHQSVLATACSGRLTEDWRREHLDVKHAMGLLERIFKRRLDEADTPAKEQRIKDIYSYREEQDSVLLPPSWKYIALDKLCKSFQYGTSKKSMPEGKIPVLRMGNLQNGEIDWNSLVYTSNEEEIEKYSLEPETVLFNRTNSPELVGKTAIYRGECPAIFAGYLIRINNYQELDSEYLNYCLNTTQEKEHCLKVKTDGVSQSNINAQKLGKFEISFCSLEEQQEIVRRVDTLFKVVKSIEDRYNKANAQVDNLSKSLLAKAFRGELVPQDSNDEPASVLLERIKQERAEQKEMKKAQKRKSKMLLDFN